MKHASKLPTKFVKIVQSALLAPSSHNTQPWLISYKDSSLFFAVDQSRKLPVADPTNRELYVSIGCCIANAMIEANQMGFETELVFFPLSDYPLVVAEMKCRAKKGKLIENELAQYIPLRLSNRSEYKPNQTIPQELIRYSSQVAKSWQVECTITQDASQKKTLARLTKQAMITALSRDEFRNELTHWVRHNWTKKEDGMPGYVIGLGNVPSLLFPALIHAKSMPESIGSNEYQMVVGSTAVGVISIHKDVKQEWVYAGIALEQIWLQASALGVSFSLLSGSVEVDESRKKVQKVLGIRMLPSVFFRIGFATKTSRPSPRRSFDTVLISFETLLSKSRSL